MPDLDQARSLKPLGELAEQQRAGKGDDLRQQQRQEQPLRIQAQGAAVGRRHLDDGVHAVDEEEEREKVEEDVLLPADVAQRAAQAAEALADGALRARGKVRLPVAAPGRARTSAPTRRR